MQGSVWSTAAALPGAHVSIAADTPPGYEKVGLDEIYGHYQQGEDIWLHASSASLDMLDTDNAFRAWLQASGSIHFSLDEGDLYWIPGDPGSNRLDYLESHGLAGAMDVDQRVNLLYERGNRLRSEDDFPPAISAYEAAIALAPDHGASYTGLGAAYLGVGRHEEAVNVLQRAIQLRPDDYWAHRLLGNAYLNLNRYSLAADELTQAYILNPYEPHLLIGIALAQGRSGQTELALQTLSQLRDRTGERQLLAAAEALRLEFTNTED